MQLLGNFYNIMFQNTFVFFSQMLTIILLEKLVTYLRQMGYSQMALPALALADVISKDILKNEPLTTLVHLRLEGHRFSLHSTLVDVISLQK